MRRHIPWSQTLSSMEVGLTLMRRGGSAHMRALTAAQQDEAPFYEAPAAAASFGSRCQEGKCLR